MRVQGKPHVTLQQAQAARAYEAAMSQPSRRNPIGANLSHDAAVDRAIPHLREWGRYLEENSDVACTILAELVKSVIGKGIITIPKPLNADGSINQEFGSVLIERQRRWAKRCDVTGELSWSEAQRLIGNAWFRDGEHFIQHVGEGSSFLFAQGETPYRIELLESDMCPWELTEPGDAGWRQGVRRNAWKMPLEYAFYREHPGDFGARFTSGAIFPDPNLMKRLPANIVTHIKLAKRWPATRGVSIFAPIVSRLYDIKDLEESERIKNRILASWTAAVVKSPDVPGHEQTSESGERFLSMAGGTVIDTLTAGESIVGVGPDYPVTDMNVYVSDQLRYVAGASGSRYSSISKRYDGNYSSQRQELVESEGHYQIRTDQFCSKVVQNVYERMVLADLLTGNIALPPGMDLERAMMTEHRGPVTPWIDMLKEVQADALAVQNGFATQEQIQIKRGAPPELITQTAREPAQLTLLPGVEEDEEDAA